MVNRMNELKEKQEPGSSKKDKDAKKARHKGAQGSGRRPTLYWHRTALQETPANQLSIAFGEPFGL